MRALFLAAVLWLVTLPAQAEAIILKCRFVDGMPIADLTIDLDKGTFVFGHTPYTITQSSDEYITAFENVFSEVGGEIFTINRITGEFKRALVGIFYTAEETEDIGADGRPKAPGRFDALIYTGRCGRKLF